MDLPFKKQTSAIAMLNAQLLFTPYSYDQIISILEEKINMKFSKFPMKLHQIKTIFFNLVDEQAMKMIALKVSKINGDIRVAFDLMKSALTKLQIKVKYNTPQEVQDEEVVVTKEIINQILEEKYGSKVQQILESLPRQDHIVLEALITIFE